MSSSKTDRVPRSMQLYQRALELIPGGTQLVSRRPTRYAYGVSPIYAARAKGARFWDIDGNEYIDWVSGIGAIILGYADPVVDQAVRRQMESGTVYSINHPLEVELAEELVSLIPCAEMCRFAKGGGEACVMAVRIARGATGREKVLFSGYHGWHDWYLAANLDSGGGLDQHLFSGIEPIGVADSLRQIALPFAYGDLPQLQQLLDQHHGQVAAIIMEPFRSDPPPDGYLQDVANLAAQHDVVLIFDEVSTGFRPSSAGVQPVVGVTPDMAVFAKSISNGYPMAAVVGKRAVMEAAANMFISSTYWGDTIGLRAALTTLREIRSRDVPSQLDRLGQRLQSKLTAIAGQAGLAARCCGVSFHPRLEFEIEEEQLRRKISTLYIQEMALRGCHGYASFYLNAAQGESELQQTCDAAAEVFPLLAAALNDGAVDSMLCCDLQTESFRRMVS